MHFCRDEFNEGRFLEGDQIDIFQLEPFEWMVVVDEIDHFHVVISWHSNVDVIVPGDESLMTDCAKQSTADERLFQIQTAAEFLESKKDVKLFFLYLVRWEKVACPILRRLDQGSYVAHNSTLYMRSLPRQMKRIQQIPDM